jgi:uncharacterized membrane protein YidH (DUF202 family)
VRIATAGEEDAVTDVVETSSAITATPGTPGTPGKPPESSAVLAGPRLEQFEAEIAKLKVKGGRADRERVVVILAVLATIAGFIVTAIGITGVRNAGDQLEQGDSMSTTILGVGIAIVGVVVWARCSLSRYLRYWLVRDLYEQRASTDRIVEAIERQTSK